MQYGAFLPHIGPLARGDVLTHIRTTAHKPQKRLGSIPYGSATTS